jgi:hypothetical protein
LSGNNIKFGGHSHPIYFSPVMILEEFGASVYSPASSPLF